MHNAHEICFFLLLAQSTFLVTTTMKRSMPRTQLCLDCSETFNTGWTFFHHKKLCQGNRRGQALTPTPVTMNECMDSPCKQKEDARGEKHHDLGEEQSQDLGEGGGIAPDVPVAQPAIYFHRSLLGDKTKEILDFLGTAEMGDGCSREHAQGWLDYQHRNGGRNASVLPKDIRTCWQHVAKVCKDGVLSNHYNFHPLNESHSYPSLSYCVVCPSPALGLRAVPRILGDGHTNMGQGKICFEVCFLVFLCVWYEVSLELWSEVSFKCIF